MASGIVRLSNRPKRHLKRSQMNRQENSPMSDDDRYAFEKIPHGRLVFKVNRRKLLLNVISEFQAIHNKADGKPILKLADLGNCPDDEIARMVPVVVPNCHI